jgi:hypothetical protein
LAKRNTYLNVVPLNVSDQGSLIVAGSTPRHNDHFSPEILS